jgi:RNA polymerase sigma-70 factor (ECF subfamily)
MEDAELAALARDGDIRAYEELVRRHQRLAFRVAWLITRNSQEAEDAVQEAFVKTWFALEKFRKGAPFKPWVLRIVANESKNRVRSMHRREVLALRWEAVDSGDAAPSPESSALSRDDAEVLVRALDRLREGDRLVIAYRWLLELSEAEMSDLLGVPAGTVKSRLSRAMARLRDELESSEVPA